MLCTSVQGNVKSRGATHRPQVVVNTLLARVAAEAIRIRHVRTESSQASRMRGPQTLMIARRDQLPHPRERRIHRRLPDRGYLIARLHRHIRVPLPQIPTAAPTNHEQFSK